MSATDELRRMLDERGIEYTTLSYSDATWWTDTNGFDWCYEENCCSTHLTCCSLRITPAQAIAATLGETDNGCYLMRDGKKFSVELDYGFLGIMPIAITVGGLRYLIEVPNEE